MFQSPNPDSTTDFWIFGYGSLIWKPPPHYDRRIPGYITGYVRRFWQASEDHRGTPLHPGRVVTLISSSHYSALLSSGSSPSPSNTDSDHRVRGVAYHIPTAQIPAVKAYLDIREINGYSIQYTTFYPSPSSSPSPSSPTTSHPIIENCMAYIGLPSNPQFLGFQDQQALAERIVGCRGPSGENREYLFMLRDSLGEMGVEGQGDEHVEDLARRVELLVSQGAGVQGSSEQAVEREMNRVKSGITSHESEEIEKKPS